MLETLESHEIHCQKRGEVSPQYNSSHCFIRLLSKRISRIQYLGLVTLTIVLSQLIAFSILLFAPPSPGFIAVSYTLHLALPMLLFLLFKRLVDVYPNKWLIIGIIIVSSLNVTLSLAIYTIAFLVPGSKTDNQYGKAISKNNLRYYIYFLVSLPFLLAPIFPEKLAAFLPHKILKPLANHYFTYQGWKIHQDNQYQVTIPKILLTNQRDDNFTTFDNRDLGLSISVKKLDLTNQKVVSNSSFLENNCQQKKMGIPWCEKKFKIDLIDIYTVDPKELFVTFR